MTALITNRQWVNLADEGAPHALLGRLGERVPIDSIDTLWIFPTRRAPGFESTVAVVSAFDPEDPARRRVGAVRWLVSRDRKGVASVEEQVHEYASAPADRVPAVLEGVVRRLGNDAIDPLRAETIAGDPARWLLLIRELGGPADPPDAADDPASAATATAPDSSAAASSG